MDDLPMMYMQAPPGSVLSLAVRAVAYADVRNQRADGVSFAVKARNAYGAALSRMRTVADDEQRVANDRVLVALLLIDNFEVSTHQDIASFLVVMKGIDDVSGALRASRPARGCRTTCSTY